MGDLPLVKEEMRDARIVGWLASSLRDLRHGVVLLHRDAGISALVVLVLALGIGGNAAVFTLLKAAFLDPLPYRDAGRLVTVMEKDGWVLAACGSVAGLLVSGWIARLLVAVLPMRNPLLASAHSDARLGSLLRYR